MLNTQGRFYLGRHVNAQSGQTTDQPLLYDPDDLVTHAVVVGMTGSGKTGLCLDLLEEAALNNIPALMIDPKGDITNALLHFPDLAAEDFQPWINASEARREGKTAAEAAAETAARWQKGLAEWDITPERIQALKDGPRFSIYTPGSDAGLALSILASLKAPHIPWDDNRELLREKISGTVTALLGLVGLKEIDPVRSREHILLANIFEHAWQQRQDLDLAQIIMQTQSPPFAKLGVFDVNTFFPEKDRFELAMMLNNILAAPAFQAWIEGEPLDVARLLYTADGRPRHTIFYIAHLPEAERMFFVTLLYSAVESWMRAQSGSTTLRALVYFDEIFGYLPPVGNPPSKEPMLRMLKQARAFGVGMVLATQNPVDIDYKALSNAGTWFIGKLATEQDKDRLLDGLATATEGGLDRRQYDDLISRLGKRVFLLRNVHEPQPQLFHTRWAMNYLAGPVTRNQIADLNALAGVTPAAASPPTPSAPSPALETAPEPIPTPTPASEAAKPESTAGDRPKVPANINEYFLPVNLTPEAAAAAHGRSLPANANQISLLYRPTLLAQANMMIRNRKHNMDIQRQHALLVHEPKPDGTIRWQDDTITPIDRAQLKDNPAAKARFEALEPPLTDAKLMRQMQTDFVDWLYHNTEVPGKANETLKVYAGPDVSAEAFKEMCLETADPKYKAEAKKVAARHDKKIEAARKKLAREERELKDDEAELSYRKREEAVTHAETVFSLFTGRRNVRSSLSKRRQTERAKQEVQESLDEIEALKREIRQLEEEKTDAIEAVRDKWMDIVDEITEVGITPYKKDIDPALFGVAWFPYHVVQIGDRTGTLPGFKVTTPDD